MRFLHTSDWHTGRHFHERSLLEDQQFVFDQVIASAESLRVDAIVIAGDLYDRSVPSAGAVELLDHNINILCSDLGIPVVVIPGNHDGATRVGFGSRQMALGRFHVLSRLNAITQPVRITSNRTGQTAAFYGIPFNAPEQVRAEFNCEITSYDEANQYLVNLIKAVRRDDEINVLVNHCFVSGSDVSDSENMLSVGGSDQVGYQCMADFDYVALGHLHKPQHCGEEHIRYSGSPLKYSFSEQNHIKGMTLVSFDAKGQRTISSIPLQHLRDVRIVEGSFDEILAAGATDTQRDDYIAARILDTRPILNALGRLREVYPNLLSIERPRLLELAERTVRNTQGPGRSDLALFRDFFQQTCGEDLSERQESALIGVLEDLKREAN